MQEAAGQGAGFKDHFSGHAASYAAHRPVYPDALFSFLASCCEQRQTAWDCATGNGQAARSLLPFFDTVIATDASADQVATARREDRLHFRVAAAEASGIDSGSVDLITVAQALHWFDIERFFAEAKRVLKPGGILSVWCYERCRVDSDVDALIEKVFAEVEPFWPPERDIVENHYQDIGMPFSPLPVDRFQMTAEWHAADMLGYMRTWSASQRYLAAKSADPTAAHGEQLEAAWGSERRVVTWPITLLATRK